MHGADKIDRNGALWKRWEKKTHLWFSRLKGKKRFIQPTVANWKARRINCGWTHTYNENSFMQRVRHELWKKRRRKNKTMDDDLMLKLVLLVLLCVFFISFFLEQGNLYHVPAAKVFIFPLEWFLRRRTKICFIVKMARSMANIK